MDEKTNTHKTHTHTLSPSSVCLSASLPLSPSCPVMCSGQTLWLLGVSGMIIERAARKDIPLLFTSLEPSLLVLLRSIAGRNCSGVSFI